MRTFISKHPALCMTAAVVGVVIALDRLAALPTLAILLSIIWMVSLADAWDEEARP